MPGLVLAIIDEGRNVRLVERDRRKGDFLRFVAKELGLLNVEILEKQVAELGEGTVQSATCRGFMPLSKALVTCRGVFCRGGEFYLLKGDEWSKEYSDIPAQVFSSWELDLAFDYTLPESKRKFAVIKAVRI